MQDVFITGNIANGGNYEGAGEFMAKLLAALHMSASLERVFWAAGSHDVNSFRLRQVAIHDIRRKADSPAEFEEAMKDTKTRNMLTEEAMAGYLKWQGILLNRTLTGEEVSAAHVSYVLPDLNLVVLNTCLTACDRDDEKQLYIKEEGLFKVFEGLDGDKPTFAIGHHGRDFFALDSRIALAQTFDAKGVDLYLCGRTNSF